MQNGVTAKEDGNRTGNAIQSRRQEIRKRMKQLRRALGGEEKQTLDCRICDQLLDERTGVLSDPRTAMRTSGSAVYCYVSYGAETDTRMFLRALWEQEIPVALPRVEGERMRFYLVRADQELEPGCMGIPEPKDGCPAAHGRPGPVITPGLAFGRDGTRLGYGGGYYDRFFEAEPDHLRIAIAYPFQVWETLPCQTWDQKVDRILTGDSQIICGGRETDRS